MDHRSWSGRAAQLTPHEDVVAEHDVRDDAAGSHVGTARVPDLIRGGALIPFAVWRGLVEAVHRTGEDAVLEGHTAVPQLDPDGRDALADEMVEDEVVLCHAATLLSIMPQPGWTPRPLMCVGVVEVEVVHSDVLVHRLSP